MGSSTDTPVWTIDPQEDQKVTETIADARADKVYKESKASVAENPITNRRSKHLKQGKYKGMYRWKKPPYRFIYGADKNTHTVYPAVFDTRGNIDYD
ncbi:hypothetical protein KKE78_00455 [Patescibacteria group bacterium]|nr:hypothetical protein [Patescibacteria group bacterium]